MDKIIEKYIRGIIREAIENVVEGIINDKVFYHGRKMGGAPYKGIYIFITDSLGYASGYSDGKTVYKFKIPFSEDKIFSIKNKKHLELISKYVDKQTIEYIIRDSGIDNEIDWAALGYISTDEYEDAEDLLKFLGFYGVKLKEREGIDSIFIFDESKLKYIGQINLTNPDIINKIGSFYKDFTKDKNFL